MNSFSGDASSIDWNAVNFNDAALMLLPQTRSNDTSMSMGEYLNEAVHFLARVIFQLSSKSTKHTLGTDVLFANLDNFYILSFILRMINFEKAHEYCVYMLLQHPFITGDTSALKFSEVVNYAHVTDTDILIGCRDGSVHVVDMRTLKKRNIVESEKCHTEVQCITSLGQTFVVSGKEGKISIWKLDSLLNQCRQVKVISCHDNKNVRCIRMQKTFLVTYGSNCKIMVYRWIATCDSASLASDSISSQTESLSKEDEKIVQHYAEFKTNGPSRNHSMTLQEPNLFFVDVNCLKYYRLDPQGVKPPEMMMKMDFQGGLRCLTPSSILNHNSSHSNEVRENLEKECSRYFWVGTDQPAQILKVDLETQRVVMTVSVFEQGFVAQLVATEKLLFCYLHEPVTTYATCICYEIEDLKSSASTSSAPTKSTTVPFRQFVNFGKITSKLRVKGDNHLFYYFRGEFCHLSFRDIVALPKRTTLRLHPEFDSN